jgi:AcrR family transcriptional regulator
MTYFIVMGPRDRMIVSTALLVRERGGRATSLDDVLAHSGAPRGSVYHHFPGGREELLREATDYAAEYVARRLERVAERGPLDALDALVDHYAETLVETEFRAGCPIAALAVESREAGVKEAFARWQQLIAGWFGDGERAQELAMVVIASIEGALILCRAYRDLAPLEAVRRRLREQIREATP